jgi:hypothetical protein
MNHERQTFDMSDRGPRLLLLHESAQERLIWALAWHA